RSIAPAAARAAVAAFAAAGAATPGLARLGLVDGQSPAVHVLAAERRDGGLRLLVAVLPCAASPSPPSRPRDLSGTGRPSTTTPAERNWDRSSWKLTSCYPDPMPAVSASRK